MHTLQARFQPYTARVIAKPLVPVLIGLMLGSLVAGCFGRDLGPVSADGTITAVGECTIFRASNGTEYTLPTLSLPLPSGFTLAAYPEVAILGPDGAVIARVGDQVFITGRASEPGGDTLCAPPFLRVDTIR